jgi:hypothetical protein
MQARLNRRSLLRTAGRVTSRVMGESKPAAAAIADIDAVLAATRPIVERSAGWMSMKPPSHADAGPIAEAVTLLMACTERLGRVGSFYRENAANIYKLAGHPTYSQLIPLAGNLRALRADFEAGRLRSLEELVHAEVFADFLDMCRYYLRSGHKDAAAVISGSVLEEHLRKLAIKAGVPLVDEKGEHRKIESINAELAKASVYGGPDQKQVTASLSLRNYAAHGDYTQYELGQVKVMVDAIADFIRRHPA